MLNDYGSKNQEAMFCNYLWRKKSALIKTSAFPKASIFFKTKAYNECAELHISAIICNPGEKAKKKKKVMN